MSGSRDHSVRNRLVTDAAGTHEFLVLSAADAGNESALGTPELRAANRHAAGQGHAVLVAARLDTTWAQAMRSHGTLNPLDFFHRFERLLATKPNAADVDPHDIEDACEDMHDDLYKLQGTATTLNQFVNDEYVGLSWRERLAQFKRIVIGFNENHSLVRTDYIRNVTRAAKNDKDDLMAETSVGNESSSSVKALVKTLQGNDRDQRKNELAAVLLTNYAEISGQFAPMRDSEPNASSLLAVQAALMDTNMPRLPPFKTTTWGIRGQDYIDLRLDGTAIEVRFACLHACTCMPCSLPPF